VRFLKENATGLGAVSGGTDNHLMLVDACMKYWEIIADNLKKAGWSLGYVSAVDSKVRTIWIADTHRGDAKRSLCEPMKR
jgi:hypothetical protein